MNNKSIIALIIIFLCLTSSLNVLSLDDNSPKIIINPDKFDFGKVQESVELKHTFKITNTGKSILLLNGAYSSCGCTIPKLNARQLKPGESTDLLIIVDTAMKQGKITKTVSITSNDPTNPTLKLNLSMNVLNPHTSLTAEARAKIFTSDKCNSCHVMKGNGLFGKDLFDADCAMCHGKQGLGAIGPQLLGPYENNLFKEGMEKIASYGSKTHHSMPGFLVDAGGPLNKEQIDSILKYLAQVSKQRYYPGKVMPSKNVSGSTH